MIVSFIKLRIRETTRSSVWDKNLFINILFALLMLYVAVNFLVIGFFLDKVLIDVSSGGNPVETLNRLLLYYFGIELLIRFFMQSTPAMSITPFLHLSVKRSFLMHFLLARNIINPVNYISFLIFVPFAVKTISTIYSGAAVCYWLFSLFFLLVFIIYVNVYIKRQMVVKPVVSLGCGLIFVSLIALDYFKIFSLSEISLSLFSAVLTQSLWALVPVLLAVVAYLFNYRFLITHSYPEEIDRTNKKKQVAAQSLGFMSRFGQIGELIGLELKLILRHKRPKQFFYMSIIFLTYGLIFYPNHHFANKMAGLIFVGIFITGLMMINYGQFLVAWEGKFFDGILTRKGSFFDYFRAKYYLLVLFCFVSYILTIPYAFFGMKILWIQTVCFFFNIGVNIYVILWFAQFNRKRMELTQGTAMNWQGVGFSQFILMLPLMLLPIFIMRIFIRLGLDNWGLGVLAILGIIGVLCHNRIIQSIYRSFTQTKYKQAEGFRSSG